MISHAHAVDTHFKIFSDFPIVAAFSNSSLNMVSGHADSENNRREFLTGLGIGDSNLVRAMQIHSANIVKLDLSDRGRLIPDTDSFITNSRNLAIAVFCADCLAVFIYDKENKAIGLVHAGWRGTKDEITKKTIILMQEKFDSKIENLFCAFGPAIGSCCYQITEDVAAYFSDGLVHKQGKTYLDLCLINKNQLFSLGLKDKQIENSNICTSCNNDFFSYRRDKDNAGRMMSVMMIK